MQKREITMNDETRRALNAAYAAFAGYEAPRYLERAPGVPHDVRHLSIGNWEKLDADNDLGVLLYNDDDNVFRHFLPRWLEFVSSEEATSDFLTFWDAYDLSHHLQRERWKTWPANEVAALREVFLAWTREETQKYEGAPPLWFLQKIEEDIAPHLEIWLNADLLAIAQYLWEIDWPNNPDFRRWVVSSRLESELEAAFFVAPDGPNAELFSRSVELVRSLRAFETNEIESD